MGSSVNLTARPLWEKGPNRLYDWSQKTQEMVALQRHLPLLVWNEETRGGKAPLTYKSKGAAIAADAAVSNFCDQLAGLSDRVSVLRNQPLEPLVEPHADLLDKEVKGLLSREKGKLPLKVEKIFERKLSDSSLDVESRVAALLRTVFTAKSSKLRESTAGNDGVLLMHRAQPERGNEGAVLKWTDDFELASGEIFSLLSDVVKVPRASLVDFKNGVIVRRDKTVPLEENSSKIKANLLGIRSQFTKKDLGKEQVMLSERVAGANLWDFAQNDWTSLSARGKDVIYRRIGEAALIDLLTGHLDRLNGVHCPVKEEFDLTFSANMGNLMVHLSDRPDKKPTVYAIDNPVEKDCIVGGYDYEEYNKLVEKTLYAPDWEDKMAKALKASLLNTVLDTKNVYYENTELTKAEKLKLRKKFIPFIEDLQTHQAALHLKRGLCEARDRILFKLAHSSIKEGLYHIEEKYTKDPESTKTSEVEKLCDAVRARLDILRNAYKHSLQPSKGV